MLIKKLKGLLLALFVVLVAVPVEAKEWKVSVAQLPMFAESEEKGLFIDLLTAMSQVTGDQYEIKLYPFKRSLHAVQTGKADFQIPIGEYTAKDGKTPDFDYSTDYIFQANFVLYSNKSKQLDMSNLGQYNIETDTAHLNYFPFAIKPSDCLDCSLKKVDAGRIDGFLFAEPATDPVLKQLGLKNIRRQFYKQYPSKMALPKGSKGSEVDQMISKALKALRENGQLEKMFGTIDKPYVDWQP